jgi:hypothetical protein
MPQLCSRNKTKDVVIIIQYLRIWLQWCGTTLVMGPARCCILHGFLLMQTILLDSSFIFLFEIIFLTELEVLLITLGNVVHRLWLHFSAVYIITGVACYLLYHVSNFNVLLSLCYFLFNFAFAFLYIGNLIPCVSVNQLNWIQHLFIINTCVLNLASIYYGFVCEVFLVFVWFHISTYAIFLYVLPLQDYKYIAGKRLEYFMTSKPLPQHFTVLVRAIPRTDGGSVSEAVDKFFKQYHSSTYLSGNVVHQTGKLRRLVVRYSSLIRLYCIIYE